MRFSTKDLMITVLPRTRASGAEVPDGCLFHSHVCIGETKCEGETFRCQTTMFCTWYTETHRLGFGACLLSQQCPYTSFPTIFCTPFGALTRPPMVINDREDLIALREELRETLKELDKLESKMPVTVGSKAEAKAIEDGLKEVIQQVNKAAKGLK